LQDLTGAVVQSVPPSLPLLSGSVPRSTILVAISETVSFIFKSSMKFINKILNFLGEGNATKKIWSAARTSVFNNWFSSCSNKHKYKFECITKFRQFSGYKSHQASKSMGWRRIWRCLGWRLVRKKLGMECVKRT
jgi:hypothetical protein